jgi:hypothetical protein
VLVLIPWPQGVPLPGDSSDRRKPRRETLPGVVLDTTIQHFHAAFGRIRRIFARMGVQVICAASEESVPLVLRRMELIRSARLPMGGIK